jgi:EAL domain-containing protein (putative c-di-GMP-specific phosphodiesterase class I)
VTLCAELNIRIVAEGIETADEMAALADLEVDLFQGYFFARPAFEALPALNAGILDR